MTEKSGKKNSIQKSIRYIIKRAKRGSKPHIALIAGFAVCIVLIFALFVGAVFGGGKNAASDGEDMSQNELDAEYNPRDEALDTDQLGVTVLQETADAGKDYIDETLFIGDSNTVRTMLYGYTTWDNVIAAVSMGVQHIDNLQLVYFKGYKNPMTVIEAVEVYQPKRIIITYGTNNLFMDTDEFIERYRKQLKKIYDAYPYSDIIVNAVPPLDKERENTLLTMQAVDKMNKAIAEMCKEEGYKFLNSSEALKDRKTGFAKKDYTIGDGVHLSMKGMEALMNYITTHAYITEDIRPKPLKKVPARDETPTGIITEDPIAVRGSRVTINFVSSDTELGKISGEIQQKVKRTLSTTEVIAEPVTENGGIFIGWSCDYEGLSSKSDEKIKFTVPKVDENVTEITVTANFAKASINIKKDSEIVNGISLNSGETAILNAAIVGNFQGDKTVEWESEDKTVATVDKNGVVKAVSGGTTKIYASICEGKIYAYTTVTVKQALESISISGDSGMKPGTTAQLKLVLNPEGANANADDAVWSSDNESVATVSQSGLVTAKGEGTVTITVKLDKHEAKHKITVTASKPLQSIQISGNTTLEIGEYTQLTVTFTPSDTTDSKSVKWSSSDTSVATVTEGKVTAEGAGTVKIKAVSGSCEAEITITVNAAPTPPPHTHEWTETARVEAGPGTDGSVTYSCTCGETKTEIIPALPVIEEPQPSWEPPADPTPAPPERQDPRPRRPDSVE